MNRRGFFYRAAAAVLFSPTVDVYQSFGGFYVRTIMERNGNTILRLAISVETNQPYGKFYRTTVLERLRAAGIVEANDPLEDFVAVDSLRNSDAFVKIITVRTQVRRIRVSGDFVFTVDYQSQINAIDGAGTFFLSPRSSIQIMLAPGRFGKEI